MSFAEILEETPNLSFAERQELVRRAIAPDEGDLTPGGERVARWEDGGFSVRARGGHSPGTIAGAHCRATESVKLEFPAGSAILDSIRRKIISSTPDVMGGTSVFAGTRVPVQTLIDYIEGGESIDDFLEGFPTVKREQVIAFFQEATKRMLAAAA